MNTNNQHSDHKNTRLAYSGVCNDHITVRLIEIFSQHQNLNIDRTTQKRIPYLIAESFQNIIRHGAKPASSELNHQHECFEVELSEDFLNIISTNLVANNEVEDLIKQLNVINGASQEELKAMRFEIISTGTLSEKGGAGLGLIELARKSENNILFAVHKIDENYSTITFDIKMNLHDQHPRENKSIANRKSTCLKDTILYYKGRIGKKIKSQIQQILSENFSQIDADKPFNWLDQVVSIFGDTQQKVNRSKSNRVEMVFKRIHENIDFIANQKIVKTQIEQLQSIAERLNIERNFSFSSIDENRVMASLKTNS